MVKPLIVSAIHGTWIPVILAGKGGMKFE